MKTTKQIPFSHHHSWANIPDFLIPSIMAEYRDNGGENIVISSDWGERIIEEPPFFPKLKHFAHCTKINLFEIHAPYDVNYALCCINPQRRKKMIEEHYLVMSYAAEVGCKTYVMHIGAFESILFQTPNENLRPAVIASLEALLPLAEELGIIIAIENGYERNTTLDELMYYINYFNSPWLGICLDTGHANILTSFPGKDRSKYSSQVNVAWGGGNLLNVTAHLMF